MKYDKVFGEPASGQTKGEKITHTLHSGQTHIEVFARRATIMGEMFNFILHVGKCLARILCSSGA
jgi:hypothetical protein